MKKIIVILSLILCILPIYGCNNRVSKDYLRIHIRANSNLEADQDIKYYAKDLIVTYLSDKLVNCKTKSEAVDIIVENADNIENLVDNLLANHGFKYKCQVEINNEYFPTRTYDNLTLTADFYDAVIIKLGTGEGNNWWCVVYPNMCFNNPSDVVYKSKILEIINKIKG